MKCWFSFSFPCLLNRYIFSWPPSNSLVDIHLCSLPPIMSVGNGNQFIFHVWKWEVVLLSFNTSHGLHLCSFPRASTVLDSKSWIWTLLSSAVSDISRQAHLNCHTRLSCNHLDHFLFNQCDLHCNKTNNFTKNENLVCFYYF